MAGEDIPTKEPYSFVNGTDLITKEDFKEALGISTNNTLEDLRYDTLIKFVSSFIKNYCGHSFIDYNDTANPLAESFDGRVKTVRLTQRPLIEVVSVKESLDGGKTTTELTEFEDYVVDYANSSIHSYDRQQLISDTPTTPVHSLIVNYTAGYSEVPEDIKLCAIYLVRYFKDNEYAPNVSAQGANVEYDVSRRLPVHIKATLDLYRLQE